MIFENKAIALVVMLGVLLVLPSCWQSTSDNKSESKKDASLVVINVLDKDLYNDCHIKGSIQVSYEDIETYAKKLDKNTQVVVYCSNYWCTASGEAYQIFKQQGFNQAWAYEAGMAEWYQKGLPVEGPCQSPYLKKTIEKPASDDTIEKVISTQELYEKMKTHGLLS